MERKAYSRDFKLNALKLSDKIGLTPAAEKLGVPSETLKEWRKARTRFALERYSLSSEKSESVVSMLESLQQEVQELKRTNTILLDALQFLTAAKA